MNLLSNLEKIAEQGQLGLNLSVYSPTTLEQILTTLQTYLSQPKTATRSSWWPFTQRQQSSRLSPLLLCGPVGTGKTTLMMLLDRALPEASSQSLFKQKIYGHPTTAQNGNEPVEIKVHPLALMGQHSNISTGVIRLRELQTFFRLFTYNRHTARQDDEAAKEFAQLFKKRIVFIDEFVPDVVTSFPMQVVNHLADHGVLVVLSSNRSETPYVEGVQIIAVEGDDMRTGDLSLVCRPAAPEPRFDAFSHIEATSFNHVARDLWAKVRDDNGRRSMYLDFEIFSYVAADWLAFQHLLQFTEQVLLDHMPIFDLRRGGSSDVARRFAIFVDTVYDERRPIVVRLTNEAPLPEPFEAQQLKELYLPEIIIDLERAISRLRQLSALAPEANA